MLLAPRYAQQRIDRNLERGHARSDDEGRDNNHHERRAECDAERAQKPRDKGENHDRLLRVSFHKEAGGDGHYTVGAKEEKWQKLNDGQADTETGDDIGNDGAWNVRQERRDEENEQDQG